MPEVQPHWEMIRLHLRGKDGEALHVYLDELKPGEIARAFTRLDDGELHDVMVLLEPEDAADLVEELSDAQGADIIEDLNCAVIKDDPDILDTYYGPKFDYRYTIYRAHVNGLKLNFGRDIVVELERVVDEVSVRVPLLIVIRK